MLNNHDSFGNPPGPYDLIYDDSAGGGIPGFAPVGWAGQFEQLHRPVGHWCVDLTEVDDSLTQTGAVNSYNVTIQPYQNPPAWRHHQLRARGQLGLRFIDVPPGATNLTLFATNFTATANPPVELFVQFGAEPTTNSFAGMAVIHPEWRRFVLARRWLRAATFSACLIPIPIRQFRRLTLFAQSTCPGSRRQQTIYSSGDTPVPILDDAVTNDSIIVPDNQTISSLEVALRVQHPRISDLVFHLIGPDGTRDLLVENRGGTDPNGMGATLTFQ